MKLNPMNNLVIESGNLRLRELLDNDHDRIVQIVRKFSVTATYKLYIAYRMNKKFAGTILSMHDSALFKKILGNFQLLNEKLDNTGICAKSTICVGREKCPKSGKCKKCITKFFSDYPDDHLFSFYGPIKAPFNESVRLYIKEAIDARVKPRRKLFRMGIELKNTLIGCFVFDFIKHKNPGYPETSGDPGIFIDPDYREIHDIRQEPVWQKVFAMAAAFVEQFYPYKDEGIPIGATTHRLNRETGLILHKNRGFNELESFISKKYGERRFFIISCDDFIKKFQIRDHTVKAYNIIFDTLQGDV